MGAIATLLTNWINKEKREDYSNISNPANWFIDLVTGGSESSSGVKVNESSALKYTPFWASVRVISGTVAALPFIVYKRLPNGGKIRFAEHSVYHLLHDRPNDYMDAITFIESRQAHVLTYGNGFAEIQRDRGGRPIALWPLLPDKTFRKIGPDGTPYYEIHSLTGEINYLPDYNVLHIKGLGFDGYTGYDVVAYHKEAIGYGVAVKSYGARFFKNDASPGGVLEHPTKLSDKAFENLKKTWFSEHGGLKQAHRMQILEEGMKWTATGIEPQHAQSLQIQKYTVDDCSRIFNIPPHKIGSLERATYSNIEEQNIDFVTSTMFYWFRKWEQECNYKLFSSNEYDKLFCEILVDGLLRGNIQSRYSAYSVGRQWGWLSVNMILEKENMNPIGPQGDIFLVPMNMTPAGTLLAPLKKGPDLDKNAINQAHRKLIKSQWLRIIHKQNMMSLRVGKNDLYERQRDFAITILYEPVNAYASVIGKEQEFTLNILKRFVREKINEHNRIGEQDAEILTNEIMELIGDHHAISE